MKITKYIVILWGAVCLIGPFAALLHDPDVEITTPAAIKLIELQVLDNLELNPKEKKELSYAINWVKLNDQNLKKSNRWIYWLLSTICIVSVVVSFYILSMLKT